MMDFERELLCTFRDFIANVRTAAQRAVVQDVQSAFARTSQPVSERGKTVAAVSKDTAPSVRRPRRRSRTQGGHAAVLARAVAAIRERPGATTAQLGQTLGMRANRLRPYLQQLADGGTIRFEETQRGVMRRRAYFTAEPVNGHAEAPIMPAGATA